MAEGTNFDEENIEITEQLAEEIRSGKFEEKQTEDIDVERENDPKVIVNEEKIMKRKFRNSNTKEEIFLRGYETIFNWLGIRYSREHKEQFWEAILFDIHNNKENQYEIRLREIMEYNVRGRYFKWWNESSRKARRQRTKYFSEEWFQRRKEKELCDRCRDFGVSCKDRLKDLMRWNLREEFTREEMELIFYVICTQSGYNGTGKSRCDEDKIKGKIRKKIEKDFSEYWK
jgi:hypothetical protein